MGIVGRADPDRGRKPSLFCYESSSLKVKSPGTGIALNLMQRQTINKEWHGKVEKEGKFQSRG